MKRKAVLLSAILFLVASGCVKKVSGPGASDQEQIRRLYTLFETHFNAGNRTQLLRLFSNHYLHNGYIKDDLNVILGEGTVHIDFEGMHIRIKGIYAETSFDVAIDFGGLTEIVNFTPEDDPLGICFLKRDPSDWTFYGNQQDMASTILK